MTYLGTLTSFHTIISLVAIAAGGVAVVGLFRDGDHRLWTKLFLVTAIATSATGFLFPYSGVTPAMIVGGVALAILALVLAAFYLYRLDGAWRWIYAAGMVASLYLLVFVGVVQAFQKIAFLSSLAPTQSETPFLVAQVVTLAFFLVVGIVASRGYRPQPVGTTR